MMHIAVTKMRTLFPALALMLAVALLSVGALGYVLWQSQKPISEAELERQVVEFLKTTDVKNVWDGMVEIDRFYDHKLGGKVIVAEFTTTSGGHPDFMLEFIERHTALITLDEKGEATSAFCVHGDLQNGRIWDLINQRWV